MSLAKLKLFDVAFSRHARRFISTSSINAVDVLKNEFSSKRYQRKYEMSYIHHPGDLELVNKTLGQMIDRSAERFGEKEGLVSVHQNVRMNFIEIKEAAEKLAAGLLAIGMEPGDRFGILGPNSYEWIIGQLAAAKAGLIMVCINPAYQPRELQYCINLVGIKGMLVAKNLKIFEYHKILSSFLPELPQSKPGELNAKACSSLKHIVMMSEEDLPGTYKFNDILNGGTQQTRERIAKIDDEIEPDDITNIQFTSGTTGSPKGTTLTHHGLVNNSMAIGERLGYGEKDHVLCVGVPLFHAFGCVGSTILSVCFGVKSVLPSPIFDATENLKAMQNEKCSALYGTPTMYVDMLKVQRETPYDLSSMETGFIAAAPSPPELIRAVQKELHMPGVMAGYGMTETSPVMTMTFREDSVDTVATTVGFITGNIELKVTDPATGKVVPIGDRGELWCRGYNVMKGYWNQPDRTAETVTEDGWLKTGDLVVMTENGYFKIVGRSKDMIIRGGENIFPKEIEDVLYEHPDIQQVHICGVPDDRLGEEVCAWIKKTNESLSEDDVKAYLKDKVAYYKIPKFVIFVEEYPTTATGKVQKFKMTEETVKLLGLDKK